MSGMAGAPPHRSEKGNKTPVNILTYLVKSADANTAPLGTDAARLSA